MGEDGGAGKAVQHEFAHDGRENHGKKPHPYPPLHSVERGDEATGERGGLATGGRLPNVQWQ
jgi:hypothetical protein